MNNYNDARRLRILRISGDVLDLEDGKYMLLAVLRKLPEDAKIVRMITERAPMYDVGIHAIKVWSMSFDECPPSMEIPEEYYSMTREDVEAEKRFGKASPIPPPAPWTAYVPSARPSGECICDFAYTGLRTHKPNCPKR